MKKILISSVVAVALSTGSAYAFQGGNYQVDAGPMLAMMGGGSGGGSMGGGSSMGGGGGSSMANIMGGFFGGGNGGGSMGSSSGGSGSMGYGGGNGSMGYGGYGNGGSMDYGSGSGSMNQDYGRSGQNSWSGGMQQQFYEETSDLRRQLNTRQFEYEEMRRNPNTSRDELYRMENEIRDMQFKIEGIAERYRTGR